MLSILEIKTIFPLPTQTLKARVVGGETKNSLWLTKWVLMHGYRTYGAINESVWKFLGLNTKICIFFCTAFVSRLKLLNRSSSITLLSVPGVCPLTALPVVPNSWSGGTSDYKQGEQPVYKCQDGYTFVQDTRDPLTCTSDGTFTGTDPQCKNSCMYA